VAARPRLAPNAASTHGRPTAKTRHLRSGDALNTSNVAPDVVTVKGWEIRRWPSA
jgi:hypothetical protein